MSFTNWKETARQLKREVYALYFAVRDPRVPWYAKLLAGGIVAYALTPLDPIPDFIPVLGYLDELLLLPGAILLVRRLIPPAILAECRERAATVTTTPTSTVGAALVIVLWGTLAGLAGWWAWRWLR